MNFTGRPLLPSPWMGSVPWARGAGSCPANPGGQALPLSGGPSSGPSPSWSLKDPYQDSHSAPRATASLPGVRQEEVPREHCLLWNLIHQHGHAMSSPLCPVHVCEFQQQSCRKQNPFTLFPGRLPSDDGSIPPQTDILVV